MQHRRWACPVAGGDDLMSASLAASVVRKRQRADCNPDKGVWRKRESEMWGRRVLANATWPSCRRHLLVASGPVACRQGPSGQDVVYCVSSSSTRGRKYLQRSGYQRAHLSCLPWNTPWTQRARPKRRTQPLPHTGHQLRGLSRLPTSVVAPVFCAAAAPATGRPALLPAIC